MYQVWTKDEFEGWKRKDCESLGEAQDEIFVALKLGKAPTLTMEIPYNVQINIVEVKPSEVDKGETTVSDSSGVKGKGKVRRGAIEPVPELDKGSGNNRPDNSV